MWNKLLLAVTAAAVLAPTSAQVTVEPQQSSLRIRECDDLVFTLTASGTYRGLAYQVTVQCLPFSSGATIADFAIKNAKNSVTISAITASIELPLALKDDNDIEGDERFLCFFTSDHVSVRSGRVLLTVTDNDKKCPADQTSGCGMVPPPNCTNPNPSTQTDGVDCFCPDGMLIREDGTCALPANCIDCPGDQAARHGKSLAPTCDNPNPAADQAESFRCFCPDGMLIKTGGSCVPPSDCIDCPAGQTSRFSKTPAPTCQAPDPDEDQAESFRCFCPDGMFISSDGSCVLPNGCKPCPVNQRTRLSKVPAPACDNRNSVGDQTADFRCFCDSGFLVKDDTCVIPYDCGGVTGQAVGDPHYRTYDGLFYDLFDHCSHILTKDCADETFTVISITSNTCSGGRAPTCVEKAIVQVPELNSEVVLTGQPLQYNITGDPPPTELSVVFSNLITVTIFKLGVVVNFGQYYLTVTIPGNYFGKMCGLLGNYDGNTMNEYELPNGTVVNGPTPDFEKAYRFDYANENCEHLDPQPIQLCQGSARDQAEAFCDPLRRTAFAACHASISPAQAFTDCVLDHCICGSGICGCAVIRNYAERCQAVGITVGPIPDPCVPACPSGQVYNICSPNLPPTCTDQAGQSDPCRPGCACPNGTVFKESDRKCVDPVHCGGFVDLPIITGYRTCFASGDPHYYTFDGYVHHFQGVCFFNFAGDCKDHLFYVYSRQERCGRGTVSCTTGVIIEVKGYAGRIVIGRNGAFSPDISTLPANIFQVMRSRNAYTVNIRPLHVTVKFNGRSTISVEIPNTFFGRVCGLCGNANDNENDDFQALVNGSLQQVTDVIEFGLSFANYELAEEYSCEVANAAPRPCEGSMHRRAEEFCSKLRTKAITTGCINTINPLQFINNCIFDYCASETSPGVVEDLADVCSHFITYCAKCAEVLDIQIHMPAECLPKCATNEVYKTCGPSQDGTCVDPLPIMQPGTCNSDCFCIEGFVNHEGNCINVTDCPITVQFQGNSYSVKEGDGICIPLKASGNLNRDFEVTLNLRTQFAADDTGTAPCSCKSPGDAQVCGGSDSCSVAFKTGDEYACVYVKMDDNDVLENDRTETLTLISGDDSIIIDNQGQVALLVIDDDFNRLTVETTAYYYSESTKHEPRNHVQLSQAPGATVFAELQLESGDGILAAMAGLDFQSCVIQPYFADRDLKALFHVYIVNDQMPEDAQCFYMTLRSPKNGSSYDPQIRAWPPSRAIGWIQSENNEPPPTNGTGDYACFHEKVSSQEVCMNDIVALVTFDSEIDSKDCRLGWNATVRVVIKGVLIPQTEVNIFIRPVRMCNMITFKWGERYLVAGSLSTADKFAFVHDVYVANRGQVIWDSSEYIPVLEEIEKACGR